MSFAEMEFIQNKVVFILIGVVVVLVMIGSSFGPAPIPWWLRVVVALYALLTLPMTAIMFLLSMDRDLLLANDGPLVAAFGLQCETASLIAAWLLIWAPARAIFRVVRARSTSSPSGRARIAKWVLAAELGLLASPFAVLTVEGVTSTQSFDRAGIMPVVAMGLFPLAAGVFLVVASVRLGPASLSAVRATVKETSVSPP